MEEREKNNKIEKVVVGPVKTHKKNEIRKFADVFITEDLRDVKDYIIMDVLIPAVKKAVSEIVTDGIDMLLYGEKGHTKKSSSKTPYRSYDRAYGRKNTDITGRKQTGYSYDDITLDTRSEAEEVLFRMDELIETYGIVSVADLYDLVGITGNYTDNKYGWTDIRTARAVGVKDGYLLKLPKALPLD